MYEQRKVKYKNMSCHKNVVWYINKYTIVCAGYVYLFQIPATFQIPK